MAKVQISKNLSMHLFLPNLMKSNDKIDDLILSLKTIVENKAANKKNYLNSLDYTLKFIRNRKIMEEAKYKRC